MCILDAPFRAAQRVWLVGLLSLLEIKSPAWSLALCPLFTLPSRMQVLARACSTSRRVSPLLLLERLEPVVVRCRKERCVFECSHGGACAGIENARWMAALSSLVWTGTLVSVVQNHNFEPEVQHCRSHEAVSVGQTGVAWPQSMRHRRASSSSDRESWRGALREDGRQEWIDVGCVFTTHMCSTYRRSTNPPG
ncbi:hypothetical protein BKA93DRAFT_535132 [Sparassis latifolia]